MPAFLLYIHLKKLSKGKKHKNLKILNFIKENILPNAFSISTSSPTELCSFGYSSGFKLHQIQKSYYVHLEIEKIEGVLESQKNSTNGNKIFNLNYRRQLHKHGLTMYDLYID